MTECEKMTAFIDENFPMEYIIWEQEFYVNENDIDLEGDDITFLN
jgi:hypothetical protein